MASLQRNHHRVSNCRCSGTPTTVVVEVWHPPQRFCGLLLLYGAGVPLHASTASLGTPRSWSWGSLDDRGLRKSRIMRALLLTLCCAARLVAAGCPAGQYQGPGGCMKCEPGTFCVNGVRDDCGPGPDGEVRSPLLPLSNAVPVCREGPAASWANNVLVVSRRAIPQPATRSILRALREHDRGRLRSETKSRRERNH
jgi:hypothetical protein